MTLDEDLRRWQAAGLLDPAQAQRIRELEGGRAAAPASARQGPGITATEVVAYLGATVVLVGVGFLVATRYEQLGSAGRDLIIGLVAAGGIGCGLFMDRRSDRPAARRARAAGFFLGSLAVFALVGQVLVDNRLLTRTVTYSPSYSADNTSGDVMAAAAVAALLAAGFLWRTRAGLLAFALAALVYMAITALENFLYPSAPNPWLAEALFGVGALLLAAASEALVLTDSATGTGAWAAEILRFAAVIVPLVSALGISGYGGTDFEILAGALAIVGLAAALPRRSGGYVIAGGLGLFIVVVEVGFRHFAATLGYPVVLIASGLLLLAIAASMVKVLPGLRRRRPIGGDGVDLGQENR